MLGELMIGSYKDKETDKTVYTTEVTASRLEFADGKDAEWEHPIPFQKQMQWVSAYPGWIWRRITVSDKEGK